MWMLYSDPTAALDSVCEGVPDVSRSQETLACLTKLRGAASPTVAVEEEGGAQRFCFAAGAAIHLVLADVR